MPYVIVGSDSERVATEVQSVLPSPEFEFTVTTSGPETLRAVKNKTPDLVILDFQIGNMGAIAICLELHLEASGGRLPECPVLFLLDRRPDVFLARRAEAQGFVVKPLDPIRLKKAVTTILAGKTYEDSSFAPPIALITSEV